MNKRRGLGKGLGTGYKNLAPMDSHIHSLSAKGVKTLSPKSRYQRYETKCGFCGKKFMTTKNTANEGICYKCRIIETNAKGKSLYAKMSPDELERNLSGFTGTEQYHRLSFMPLLATDGVAYLMEQAEAHWLFDAIASYQPQLKKEEFQIWFLEKNKTGKGAVLKAYRDYSEKKPDKFKPIVTQRIGYTDFPLDKVKIYVQNGVALLPSEY